MRSLLTRILPLALRLSEHRSQRQTSVAERRLGFVSIVVVAMTLAGCGSSSTSGAKAGPIMLTNAAGVTGPVSALSVSSAIKLSMMPSGDSVNAGVDWTVICGGNPVSGSITNGSCGTLSPAHTADGAATVFTAPSLAPIGTTVTITASVTSNPSQRSNVSLTVLSTPITVAFSTGTLAPPTSMLTNMKVNIGANVTNDPIGEGVIWTASCGSMVCGSFNPSTGSNTAYTAPAVVPAGGVVTVTATSLTDTTKSANASITITSPVQPPPPTPIIVSVTPTNIYVQPSGPGRVANIVAIVSNDIASGGIDWTTSCNVTNCGTITSHTASGATASFQNSSGVAVGGTITITAKSTTDPTKTATVLATVVSAQPITVTLFAPLPTKINTGATATLMATASPGTDGVNWLATCGSAGACGSFNLSPAHTTNNAPIVYTAPATVPDGGIVTITASSAATTPSTAALTTTTVVQGRAPNADPIFRDSSAYFIGKRGAGSRQRHRCERYDARRCDMDGAMRQHPRQEAAVGSLRRRPQAGLRPSIRLLQQHRRERL